MTRTSLEHRLPSLALAVAVGLMAISCGFAVGQDRSPGDVATPRPSLAPVPTPANLESLVEPDLPTLVPASLLNRIPTRVRVKDLEIDLPVVRPPPDPDHYPYCDVAEFIPAMSRPGRPGTTFLYAHARTGMFLPILEGARVGGGRAMVGIEVEVFTNDNWVFTYQVSEVRRHVVSLDFAYRATVEQAILQTSEGPHGTPGRTLLIAVPSDERTASAGEAQPVAHPVACGSG